ncbi:MAG: hypothetical protein P8Y70_12845 [Candidatus Lokiarchaeota archaeon]
MNREVKIGLTFLIIILVAFSGILSIIFVFIPKSSPNGGSNTGPNEPTNKNPIIFEPNTYIKDSNVTQFGYAVQFLNESIVIDNKIVISNGSISGYNVINSTITNNTKIINNDVFISFALYGNTSLTLSNVWYDYLTIVLNDESSLILDNCSLAELDLTGSNDVQIINSSITTIATSSANLINLSIEQMSDIGTMILMGRGTISIIDSKIQNCYFQVTNPYNYQPDKYLITGIISNCLITNIFAYKYTDLDIYDTNVHQINIIGNSVLNLVNCKIYEQYVTFEGKAILNNSTILTDLEYGIIVKTGSLNITNGIINGMEYVNNTEFINANVTNRILYSVVVKNSAQVKVSNFSASFMLFDSANLTIDDKETNSTEESLVLLHDSSHLFALNTSLQGALLLDNSSLEIKDNSNIQTLMLNTTNEAYVENSHIDSFVIYSGTMDNKQSVIVNCSIENIQDYPSGKAELINCNITNLYEGIEFQTGSFIMSPTGITGVGTYGNQLITTNCSILNRENNIIVVKNDVSLIIEDLQGGINVINEGGNLIAYNSTFSGLIEKNSAYVASQNCTYDVTSGSFVGLISFLGTGVLNIFDNSTLTINNCTISGMGTMIMAYGHSEIIIDKSDIFGLTLYGGKYHFYLNFKFFYILFLIFYYFKRRIKLTFKLKSY